MLFKTAPYHCTQTVSGNSFSYGSIICECDDHLISKIYYLNYFSLENTKVITKLMIQDDTRCKSVHLWYEGELLTTDFHVNHLKMNKISCSNYKGYNLHDMLWPHQCMYDLVKYLDHDHCTNLTFQSLGDLAFGATQHTRPTRGPAHSPLRVEMTLSVSVQVESSSWLVVSPWLQKMGYISK